MTNSHLIKNNIRATYREAEKLGNHLGTYLNRRNGLSSRILERQQFMGTKEMFEDLPKACDVGTKMNSKGYKKSWAGYKLYIDAADGHVPISCILTSASVHDSQVALPLAELTSQQSI